MKSGNGSGVHRISRIAIIGASTEEGGWLREALAKVGVPGSRVNLYGATSGEAVLSEYAGEARLVQDPDLDELVAHRLVFLCERGSDTQAIAAALPESTTVIDLVAAGDDPHPLVHARINPEDAKRDGRCLAVPHPLATVLVELLYDLEKQLGVREVLAVVLRPAADYGEPGMEELRDQTVSLLNFNELPTDTFGRQLAFNIFGAPPERFATSDLESRISQDVQRLLGWDQPRLSLRLITAPVFHGHCLQLRFRLQGQPELAAVREVLSDSQFFDPPGQDQPATPLEVSTDERIGLSGLNEDGLGGFWLWVVVGNAGIRGADQAVQLAELLGEL